MKRWIFILPIVLCFGFISIYAQNEDTPNLSFDKGNFSGWSLNTGDYYKDLITTEYVYDWTPVNSTGQISLMNSIGTLDPIVCGKFNLQTVPDGASVSARIGVPLKCENFRSAGCSTRVANRKAMAERMTYSFIVTENTTLFTYRFATVLHIPNGGVGSGQHNGGQYPIFSIDVTVEDPLTGEKSVMPCGSYEAKADDENMSLTRNEDCYASSSPYPTEYMFRNWSTSGYDLRNHIGKKVTIDIRTHDCLVDISSSCSSYGEKAKDVPGNHEAYGYFYAQTRKLELITVNCGTTNPTIEAPQGFTTYEWSRSDGKLISPSDPTKPWFVEIPRNSMTEGVVYYCKLVSDMTNCADLTLSTELKPVVITPKFTTNFGCSGNVEFTNTTLVDGDDIRTCEWDFGDGTTSTDVSPTHQYAEGDSSYLVKLRVITNLGCEKTITQTIRVPFYPNLLVSGAKSVCYGDEIQLTVDGAEIGSTYSWTRKTVTGVTSGVLSDKAVLNVIADTSADYTVTVKDSRYCTYTQITHVSVMQHPIITISGKSPVCKEEKVELKATEGLSDYSWNIGANTSSVVVYPSQNTDYKVTAKGSNGCYGSASFPIETLDLPDVSISGKSEICEGEQVTLTATGANNYKWISDSQYIIGDSRIVKPVNDSTFTVIGYDNNGCSSIVSKQILVKKVPEVFITGEPEVCQGYTTTMTAKGASTFVWNDGSTTSTVNKVIRGDSVFTVVGSLNGCSALATYNVTMKPSPTVYVDGKTEICYGETLDLTAKGADVYSWNTGQQTANMNEKPDNSSSYWVSGAYDNGCVNKVEVKVTVNKLPDIKIDGETSVCYGSEDKLTASGEASNYFWQGINQGSTFSPIITKDTTFTVVGEDANGCKNSKSINVKTKPIPEITVTASKKDICVGASSLLTATGAANYEWNDGPMSSTYNVTPNQSTTYTVRGELNGCKSEQTVLIEVHNPPSLWIEGETNVCFGSALSLKAHGAETYKWNNLRTGEDYSDTPLSPTSYELVGTDSYGCTSKLIIPITVYSKPDINVDGDASVCNGSTVMLKATGDATSYTWDTNETGDVIQPTITKDSVFLVTGTDNHGCQSTTTKTVKVIPLPTLSIDGKTEMCKNSSVTLVANGATDYSWSTGSTNSTLNYSPQATTTIYLEGTSLGCKTRKEVQIVVRPLPNVMVSGDKDICEGDSLILTALGAEKYRWNEGTEGSNLRVVPMFNTVSYTVTGTNEYNCSSATEVPIVVHKKPSISITGDNSVCINSQTILTAQGNDMSYTWSNGSVNQTIQPTISKDTTFYVTGIDGYGCQNTASYSVTPIQLPNLDFVGNTTVCQGTSTTLVAQGAMSYKWSTGETTSMLELIPESNKTIYLEGTTQGCTAKKEIQLTVNPLPNVVVTGLHEICQGDSLHLMAQGAKSYRWDNDTQTPELHVLPGSDMTYKVTGKNDYGCSSTFSFDVKVVSKPSIKIDGALSVCENSQTTLTAIGDGLTFSWSNGDMGTSIFPVITEKKTFSVTGTNDRGCKNSANITITPISRPTLSILGKTEICQGTMTTLAAQGASEYSWSTGDNTSTISVSPMTNTTYYLEGSSQGCSAKKEVQVIVNSAPSIIVEGKREFCQGDSLILTASGAKTYTWNEGTAKSDLRALSNSSITYTVVGTDEYGCKASVSVPVTVHPKPEIQITGDNAVCTNSSVTLTAEGNCIYYSWNNGESGASVQSIINEKKTFSVTGSDIYGCKNVATYTVSPIPMPQLAITGDTVICKGDAATISAQGASDYLWSTGATSSIVNLKPETSTSYFFEGTKQGCTSKREVHIIVNPLPTIRVDGQTEICQGDSLHLFASGADSYKWSNGIATSDLHSQPASSLTFTVVGTNDNECSSSLQVPIMVHAKPELIIEGDNAACVNSTVNLTVVGKCNQLLWDDGEKSTSIQPIISEKKTFSVTGTDEYGCKNTVSHTVVPIALPILSIKGDTVLCDGGSVTVSAQGASTYLWSTGETTSTVSLSPATNTTYFFEGTTQGCTSKREVLVIVNSLPTLKVDGQTELCEGDSLHLFASGANSYKWNNGITDPELHALPYTSTSYTLTGKDEKGCSVTIAVPVTVFAKPMIKIDGESSVCIDASATLTVVSECNQFSWNNGESSVSIHPIISEKETFAVTGIDAHGCKNSASYTITPIPLPELSFKGDTILCLGSSVILSAQGASSYLWSNGATTSTVTLNPVTSQTVYFEGTTLGCTSKKEVRLTVNPLPNVVVMGDREICQGDSVHLTVSGAKTYAWGDGSSRPYLHSQPNTSVTYSLWGTDENECSSAVSIPITVYPKPTVRIDGDLTVCENSSATLTATGSCDIYQWDGGEVGNTIHPVITKRTPFFVTGTDANGCKNLTTFTVTPIPMPKLTLAGDTVTCQGNAVTLAVSGASAYLWSNGATTSTLTLSPETNTTLFVEGTTQGCSSKREVRLTVHSLPSVYVTGRNEICEGDSLHLTANGAKTYRWGDGSTKVDLYSQPNTSTKYSLVGTDENGCTSSVTYPVVVNQMPLVKIEGEPSACVNSSTKLTAYGSSSFYSWDNGTIGATIQPIVSETKTYTVTGTDKNGCKNTASLTVSPIQYPVLSVLGDTSVCVGGSIYLTGEGATSYAWSDGIDGPMFSTTPSSDMVVHLRGTTQGCTSEKQVRIHVNMPPSLVVNGEKQICKGDSLRLNVEGAKTYSWSDGTKSSDLRTKPMSSMTYKVVGIDKNGCSSETEVPVVVYSIPTIEINGDRTVCFDAQATLTASGNCQLYSWDNGTTGNMIQPVVSKVTSYTVTGTDDHGCKGNASFTVTPVAPPTLSFVGDTVVCIGGSLTLTGEGATTYSWSDGNTTPMYSVTPTSDLTVYMHGTKQNCTATRKISILVNPLPNIAAAGLKQICQGDSLKLKATGASSYVWSDGTRSASMSSLPISSSVYQVTGTDLNGCAKTVEVPITVYPRPIVKIEGDAAVCENSQAELVASGSCILYSWDEGTVGNMIRPVVSSKSTYTVVGTDEHSCRNKATFTVTPIAYPKLTFFGDTVVCYGDKVSLTADGAVEYAWSDGTMGPSYTSTPTFDAAVTVFGTTQGCTSEKKIFLHVNSLPSVSVSGLKEICFGDSLHLVATGATRYNWSDGTLSSDMNSMPLTSLVYKLEGIDANGCSAKLSVPVTVYPKPTINIEGETTTCINNQTTLTASGSSLLYIWNNGVSGNVIQPTITMKEEFSVVGTDEHGCKNSKSFTVTPVYPPKITLIGDTAVCLGSPVNLIAQGAINFKWSDGTESPSFTTTPMTDMMIYVVGSNQKCSTTREINLNVKHLPNVQVYGDKQICPGASFIITATGAETYKWSTGDLSPSITYAPIENTAYYVTGYDTAGCNSTVKYDINVLPTPAISIDISNKAGCIGDMDTVHIGAKGGLFYTWSSNPELPELKENPNAEKATVYIEETTDIILVGKDKNGCSSTAEVTVEMIPRSDFNFEVDPKFIDAKNPTVLFKGVSPLNAKWFWTPNTNAAELIGKNVKYTYTTTEVGDSVSVHVRAIDENGCSYNKDEYIYVWKPFWAPTAFTPNIDGKNEGFRFYGGKFIDEFSFIIYNRLGQIVFEGNSIDDVWDGMYKGEMCPIGVYGWVVTYKGVYHDIEKSGEEKGFVSLLK